jgi:hypothetical protein
MSMATFDLEQDILRCWNITTDLGEILDDLESGHMEFHDAVQALRAYQRIYENRFERCFRRFEEVTLEIHMLRKSTVPAENPVPENTGKMGKKRAKKAVDQ